MLTNIDRQSILPISPSLGCALFLAFREREGSRGLSGPTACIRSTSDILGRTLQGLHTKAIKWNAEAIQRPQWLEMLTVEESGFSAASRDEGEFQKEGWLSCRINEIYSALWLFGETNNSYSKLTKHASTYTPNELEISALYFDEFQIDYF